MVETTEMEMAVMMALLMAASMAAQTDDWKEMKMAAVMADRSDSN